MIPTKIQPVPAWKRSSHAPLLKARMKQHRGIDMAWQDESDARRRRWLRRLRWPFGLSVLAALGWFSGLAGSWPDMVMLLGSAILVVLLAQARIARGNQRRWRRDSRLFEPPLPKPITSVPVVKEWQWPSHPLVGIPLAIVMIAGLYWVLVVNRMQVSGGWLVAMLLLALVNLWSWRQPLLWAAVVTVGVLLSALVRWLTLLLTLPGALLVLCVAAAAITVAIRKYLQRNQKNGSTA
jgi:hypothetical protein